MSDRDKYFPSNWLKASDIKKPTVMVIDKVEEEKFDAEVKPVVYFEGIDKGLVLNVTNFDAISKICNTENIIDWTGFKVELFTMNVQWKKDVVPAIRVREPTKK